MIISAKFASVCPSCSARITVGSKVEWTRGAKAVHVACPTAGEPAAPRAARKPAAPRLPALTGVRSDLSAQFEGIKQDRSPGRALGAASWLRQGQALIAVILVGWEPASWVSSDLAEDMGHYGMASGYYGMLYFRRATAAEHDALQATSPRPTAVRPIEPVEAAS